MKYTNYGEAFMYEVLIRRAHKCKRGARHGADVCYMKNLMDAEKGSSHVRHLGSFQKQFLSVQGYLIKALDKFLSKKLSIEERARLTQLRNRTEKAFSSQQLLDVVNDGLDVTERFIG